MTAPPVLAAVTLRAAFEVAERWLTANREAINAAPLSKASTQTITVSNVSSAVNNTMALTKTVEGTRFSIGQFASRRKRLANLLHWQLSLWF